MRGGVRRIGSRYLSLESGWDGEVARKAGARWALDDREVGARVVPLVVIKPQCAVHLRQRGGLGPVDDAQVDVHHLEICQHQDRPRV